MEPVCDRLVHDWAQIRDVHAAAGPTLNRAGLDPHCTAVTALVDTEPATNLPERAAGGDAW